MIQVSTTKINTDSAAAAPASPTVCFVGRPAAALFGLAPAERLRRAFSRAGVTQFREAGHGLPNAGRCVLVRLDHVYEERLLVDLLAATSTLLVVDAGEGAAAAVGANVDADAAAPVAALLEAGALPREVKLPEGVRMVEPGELSSDYDEKLRKRSAPYVLAVDAARITEIEKRMFAGAYKGATDFVTKWLWPTPARWATKWAALRGIKPNTVTFVSLLMVLAAMWLFARGQFAAGLAAAWAMTFLDTVDGKLARVTLTSSSWGNVFDHGIDLIHPPFWYWAWAEGLRAAGLASSSYLDSALWIIIGGYVVGRLMEGVFIAGFGMEIHAWRPIDSWFRSFTARRNPNLAILMVATALARPDLGFLAVAAWTVASLAFHAVRIVQAVIERVGGRPPVSWLSS